MTEYELAQKLFSQQQAPDASMPTTSQVRGVAASDSADGTVTVLLDATAGGASAEMEVPTTGGITEGSDVLVTLLDGAPVEVSQAGSIDGAAGSATKYITETGSYGIRVHPEGDTANYSVIDADGMDVVKGGASVAQFGKSDDYGPSTRIGQESKTHIVIGTTEHEETTGDIDESDYWHVHDEISEIKLYGVDGTRPNLRLYDTARVEESKSYEEPTLNTLSYETVGIDFGENGNESTDNTGTSIRTSVMDTSASLDILTGNISSTRGAYTTIANSRGWASNPNYNDRTTIEMSVFEGGTPPFLYLQTTSGASSAEVEIAADGNSSSVNVRAKEVTLGGVGCYMTHGMVAQRTNVPANGYHDFTVDFGHTYASPPDVQLTIYTTTSATTFNCDIYLRSRRTTGFTARVVNRESSDRSPGFTWLAIG